jgi:plasmid stabilization system protein ParE
MKKYEVVRYVRFEADLAKQVHWWADRVPLRAAAILDAAQAAVTRLGEFPELGHAVEVAGAWSLTERSYAVGETGYLILYRVDHARRRVVLLRFRHEAQRPLKR